MSENTTPFIHLFKTPLSYYCYDVNTNQIIGVDKETYDYFSNLSSEKNERLELRLEPLRKRGIFSANRPKEMKHAASEYLKYELNENIQQMSLQLTQQCNFNCSYCTYAPKDFEYQREHSSKRISEETAFKALEFFAAHAKNSQRLAIGFYGGEPLLEFELIKKLIPYAEELFEGKELYFTMTTNGSLLTPDKFEYLSKHDIHINISLDGPPEMHNRSRKFAANGMGTFDAIMRNLTQIKEKHPQKYRRIGFMITADSRFENSGLYNFFDTNELFRYSNIRYNSINDNLSFEKHYMDESYVITQNKLLFKARLAEIGKYHGDISNITKSMLKSTVERFEVSMKPRWKIGDTTSHSGPCVPGQRRLFVTVDGNFLPCERISETSAPNIIGNLDEGFLLNKADKVLNICELTEYDCKNCWAITHCNLCVKFCDNNGEFSADFKIKNCQNSRRVAENVLMEYASFHDIKKLMRGEKS